MNIIGNVLQAITALKLFLLGISEPSIFENFSKDDVPWGYIAGVHWTCLRVSVYNVKVFIHAGLPPLVPPRVQASAI